MLILQDNFFALYIASLWYMINLLTITGSGDVTAQNDFEVIETIFITLVIKFCTGLYRTFKFFRQFFQLEL